MLPPDVMSGLAAVPFSTPVLSISTVAEQMSVVWQTNDQIVDAVPGCGRLNVVPAPPNTYIDGKTRTASANSPKTQRLWKNFFMDLLPLLELHGRRDERDGIRASPWHPRHYRAVAFGGDDGRRRGPVSYKRKPPRFNSRQRSKQRS